MINTLKRVFLIASCVCLLLISLCACEGKKPSDDSAVPTTTANTSGTIVTTSVQTTTLLSADITVHDTTAHVTTSTDKGTTVSTTVANITANHTTQTTTTTAATKATGTENPSPVSALTPLSPSDYYGYTLLGKESHSAALQAAYTRMVQSVENMEETIDLSDLPKALTKAEAAKVWDYYLQDYPQHFWVNGGGTIRTLNSNVISIDVTYVMTKSERDAAKVKFEAAVQEILSGISGSWSEYKRELAVHDALCDRLTYKQVDAHSFTAYGALVEKKAVCEGYAESFQYLMYRCGIQCLSAMGNAGGGPHKWNVIRVDGQYYHIDVTWDDPVSQTPITLHNYFNLSQSFMERDHTIETMDSYPLPACNSNAANYFKMKGGWLESLDQTMVAEALKSNGGKAELFFPDYTSQQFRDWFSNCWKDIFKAAGFSGRGYSMQYNDHGAIITVK